MYKIVAYFCLTVGIASCNSPEKAEKISFNYDVRPIITTKCLVCHGPDSSSREAGLRLDIREEALKILESGHAAIVPGNKEESQVVKKIYSDDPAEVMPPPESKKVLTPEEKDIITKWISQGAEYQRFWAFEPVEEYNGTIDEFVTAAQEKKGLNSDFEHAGDNTLLRRLSYTITGLPPTIGELEKFKDLTDDRNYEAAVDHYLADKGFGERWARHWLDLVRYAETRGHEFDFPIPGPWIYRNYMIRAFNNDVPYDQLVKEHLAGDLLDSPRINPETGTNESAVGTMYMALSEGTHSPVDIRKDEADRIDNIIDVTTKTFQGLTMACARCHDHKFDPIPTKDYYSLYGTIESSRFTPRPFENISKKRAAITKLDSLIKIQEKIINGDDIPVLKASLHNPPEKEKDTTVLGDFTGGDFDGWFTDGVAFGPEPLKVRPEIDTAVNRVVGVTGGYASGKYYGTGLYGALRSPTFTISEDSIKVIGRGFKGEVRIVIDNFQLIRNPIYGGLEKGLNSDMFKDLVFNVGDWKGRKAYVEILNGVYSNHDYVQPDNAFIEIKKVYHYSGELNIPPMRKMAGIKKMSRNLSATDKKMLYRIQAEMDTITASVYTDKFYMGITDGDGINSPVFLRGNHNSLTNYEVERGFFSILPNTDINKGSGRKEIAEVIVDERNPLTSRVMANRIWHHMFGRGIVETVDNFGLQGKMPSHPELLDFIATEFVNNGWSIKSLIKEIAMSQTFRQSSDRSSSAIKNDPDNIYLAGFPLRRLEAEAIRDGILAVSGSLNSEMYGESVPTYLTPFMTGRGRPESGPLDGDGRRSIYLSIKRNFLSPFMQTFDRPQPVSTFGKRNVTNVPSQSLTLLNDPFVNQQAKIWAEKLISEGHKSLEERVRKIYLTAFSREPSKNEIKKAEEFMNEQAELLEQEDIMQNVTVWKDYCHTIFNFKEFIHIM